MPDLGSSRRLAIGLTLLVLGLVDAQNLAQAIRLRLRLRDRVVQSAEAGLRSNRERLAAILQTGTGAAWMAALSLTLESSNASEAEVYDQTGRRLAVMPVAVPVSHWPSLAELTAIRGGSLVTVGPLPGAGARLLTYAAFPAGTQIVFLRMATPAPDLVDDFSVFRQLLVGHGIALVLLLAAAGAILFSGRQRTLSATPGILDAYAEAMTRLRDHGQALSQRHLEERHRMEEELREKGAMARAGELTAGMVHEVRNGLNTILGYARLLEQAASLDPVPEAAREIRLECETLETVVRRFMEFVKQDALHPARVELGRLLSRVAARESRGVAGAPVELDVGGDRAVWGDEELLERAFENLVRNAREAAGPGGHVRVSSVADGDRVAVEIADDGPGMSEEARRQLRPFYTTKPGGLGLGLALAFKIVRLHGGELLIQARSPHGLSVVVALPSGPAVSGALPDVT